MAFTPLSTRLPGLPLVLAGPLVRRVTSSSVTLWVALRFPRKVRLHIEDSGGAPQGTDASLDTRRIGAHLHIVAVTWRGTLTPGTTYTYDLIFEPHPSPDAADNLPMGRGLFEPKILDNDPAKIPGLLLYTGGPSGPSFVVPPADLNGMRILHGSCRWIAGEGPDTLPAADGMVAESFTPSATIRPQLMFFTGDQIYADGAEELFPVVFDAGPALLDLPELIPGLNVPLSLLSGERRWSSLDTAGVSNAREHHLYGIGEFLAYYLLHYSDVLWPAPAELNAEIDKDKRKNFQDFLDVLPAVRRALANIATYMIFDDHEFTDTWYCTAEWCRSVLERPMGRHILMNALSSYALCQAWGNDPDQFDSILGADLLKALEERGRTDNQLNRDHLAALLGIPDAGVLAADDLDLSQAHLDQITVNWHYTVRLEALDILVLDMFTWRSYPSKFGLCEHLSETKGLKAQINDMHLAGTECLLVVVSNVAVTRYINESPNRFSALWVEHWYAPLVTIGLDALVGAVVGAVVALIIALFAASGVLEALLIGAAIGGIAGGAVIDLLVLTVRKIFRSWYYKHELGSNLEPHSKSFEQLIARLAQKAQKPPAPGRVVILSGDVHESFTMRVDYSADHPYLAAGGPSQAVFAQLVSSPLRRYYPTGVPRGPSVEGFWAGWGAEDKPTQPTRFENSKLDWQKPPWVAGYDPHDPHALAPSRKPDWHYRVEQITPDPNQPTDVLPLPQNHPHPTHQQLVDENAKYPVAADMGKIEQAPVININNLCDVSFEWPVNGPKKVIQRIWTRTNILNTPPTWKTTRTVVEMELSKPPLMPGEPP